MGLNYLRIDDRLIHGQIVTAWCGHLKIAEIVAIDDALAANATLQSIMLMGIPKQYKSHVVTMAQAKELFAQSSDGNRLFVTRFPQDLVNLREELKQCELVIIGNAAKRADTKYNLTKGGGSVFFASEEDIRLFDSISADGVKLIYQTVPKSPAKEWPDIRRGIKLK
ncbi:MAG: PTS sugar transporter subunit IIB [Oscillospiraceae bacterium]|nr:PTS sugar transporter subunit IIB [Oscillospiraceae bacterium]